MIEQTVIIVALEKNDAWIESLPQTGCERCDSGKGCGGGIFARIFGNKLFCIKIPNKLNAELHERVIIGIPENSIISASFMIYMLPLIALIFGGFIGHFIDLNFLSKDSEIWTLLNSIFMGFISILWVKQHINQNKYQQKYRPNMLRKAPVVKPFTPS